MTTRAFLDALFSTCTGGVIELRAFPSGARTWTTPGDWSALGPFITTHVRAGQNVALGVATRRDDTSGALTNVRELGAIFVDVDQPPAKARARLERLPFRPSLVIGSGAHVHAYYRLKEPADLTDHAERTRTSSVLRRLAAHLDGDLRATDAARVLRLPGTLSFKYAAPAPVTVLDQADTVLNLCELDDALPAEVARHGELVLENRLHEGRRNDVLYSTIRSLRWRGLPARLIVRFVTDVNAEWCDPPLLPPELSTLIRHALVQGDRPEFNARQTTNAIVHDVGDEERR